MAVQTEESARQLNGECGNMLRSDRRKGRTSHARNHHVKGQQMITDVDYEEKIKASRQEEHQRVEAERNEERYANPPDYQEEITKAESRSKTNPIFVRYSK